MILLIWLHFIGDFICQNNWMALNKSKKMVPLFVHISVYSIFFIWFGWQFALINGLVHGVTDLVTSRASSRLAKLEDKHWFFVVIGFDQAVHLTTLMLTYTYFFG